MDPSKKAELRARFRARAEAAGEPPGGFLLEGGALSMAEIAARKQASRDEDARALASGEKTREQLQQENSILRGRKIVVDWKNAKPLR